MSKHVVVWIDQKEARIFHIHPDKIDEAIVLSPPHNIHHKHPKRSEGNREHPDDARRFFHDVAHLLEGAEEILIVGPSTAKLGLVRHIHKHDQSLEPKIVGIETVDHPTDGQIVAYAKEYFDRRDRTG